MTVGTDIIILAPKIIFECYYSITDNKYVYFNKNNSPYQFECLFTIIIQIVASLKEFTVLHSEAKHIKAGSITHHSL